MQDHSNILTALGLTSQKKLQPLV